MKRQILIFLSIALFLVQEISLAQSFTTNFNDFIENPAVFESGQVDGRAYYIPDEHISLKGDWNFFYRDVPEEIPADFYRVNFDDSKWDKISVPSNWEMKGYGDKIFRNVSAGFSVRRETIDPEKKDVSKTYPEFTVIPPEIPDEYNPTAAYRKSFVLPGNWKDKQVFLRFEKIASASFVWVNGREVGYNEGAHEPSEYNITPYLRKGSNLIAVMVLKYSDGYYLEGQDYWRLSGIFDDVTLYASPHKRIFDWQVITDLDEKYEDASVRLNVNVRNYTHKQAKSKLKATISLKGKTIMEMGSNVFETKTGDSKTISLSAQMENPLKWTAEHPNLYELSILLLNENGDVVDFITTRMGFKETEIIGNTFFLNGVPVKLNGINSHMQHPEYGHYVDEATIRKDFEILKQFNFNTVRTSHYPPTNKYLQLADEYGIYIIDESGDEAHATEYVSMEDKYAAMYRERVNKMVLRDRNYPSVLMWSAGNESGEGENISEVVREGKRLDPTRFWMYGGNADKHPAEDIIGPRYPSPAELELNYGLDTTDQRPSFMDEYISIAGSGGGSLEDYRRVIYQHPRLLGGALWDFVSPGLTEPVRKLEDQSVNHVPAHIMGNAKLVNALAGNAIDLNGHDQWVEIYRHDALEHYEDQLTLTFDVYPRKLNASSGTMITKGNNQFGIKQNGVRELEFYLYTTEKVRLTAELPENWENNWHKVAASYDGEQMRIFIDGILLAEKRASGKIQNFPFPVNIGRNAEKHGDETYEYLCDAIIDNVGIFLKASNQISSLNFKEAALWLDFEKEEREGEFFSYGLRARTYGAIWPDRKVQPEMWEMKKVCQPLNFNLLDAEKGTVELTNTSDFLDASFWETSWTLTEDEKVLQSGNIFPDTPPHQKDMLQIPFSKPEIIAGKEYRLTISSKLKSDQMWAPKGFEVSWEQFEMSDWYLEKKTPPATKLDIRLQEKGDIYEVSGLDFVYCFNKHNGDLQSLKLSQKEYIEFPVKLNVWRAPLANESDSWGGWRFKSDNWKPGFGFYLSTDYYSAGIHDLKRIPIDIKAQKVNNNIQIKVRERWITNLRSAKQGSSSRYNENQHSGFENIYQYTIYGDGVIELDHTVIPTGKLPQMLPRIGISLGLKKEFNNIEWYGRGPQENYPDRKSGYRVGVYSSKVEDMFEPYLMPQDNGLRTDNRWLRVSDEEGRGFEISMDQPFNFNTSEYSTDNLTKAVYLYQLKKSGLIEVNLDYATNGVGMTDQPVHPHYRVYPGNYKRNIRIRPLKVLE